MNADEDRSIDDDELAARLRAEANPPEFSEFLHQRIMQQVKSAEPRAGGWGAWRRLATVAAILIVGILVWELWLMGNSTPKEIARGKPAAVPALPDFGGTLARTTEPLGRDLSDARFGYLDRDAQRLGQFVIDQLDFIPADGRQPAQKPAAVRG